MTAHAKHRLATVLATALFACAVAGCEGSATAPVTSAAAPGGDTILTEETVRRIGVRTVAAERAPFPNETRVAGTIRYDERSIVDFYAPLAGRIEHASVRSVGEHVKADQLLFELYSPALVTTDAQYLRSLKDGADPDDNPFARGLLALGVSEDMLLALREKRRAVGRIPVHARGASVVLSLSAREGAFVAQGASILRTAAADPVWAVISVPEAGAAMVAPGLPVTVTTPAYPAWKHEGKIAYVYPEADAERRTVQARIVLPGDDPPLLPDMSVSVVLHGAGGEPVVQVPLESVIRGERVDRVIVASDGGRFEPRAVRVGRVSGERAAIIEGLREGELVVTRAVFLIDAEASLRAAIARMDADAAAAPHHH